MITTYEEAISWIHGRLRLGIKPGLSRMDWMMDKLDHPHKKIKAVHIGGTNGKGSTVTFLRSILEASGGTVGTFTSPYFEVFNERIAINGIPISDDDWLKLTQIIEPLAQELEKTELGGPTEFEVITAMMFLYFGEINPVDMVIIEVGLGGRFDSTNIVKPICSVITSIGLDHVAILGETYAEIAFEKAGIIKENVPIIMNVKQEEANGVIKEIAQSLQAPLYQFNLNFHTETKSNILIGEQFIYKDPLRSLIANTKMTGEHQIENASLAIFTAYLLQRKEMDSISDESILKGIETAFWPGRTEVLSTKPLVLMDGAHNKEGITALLETITRKYHEHTVHFLFAAVGDKDLRNMIELLDHKAASISFDSFDMPRAASSGELLALSHHPDKKITSAKDWIKKAIKDNNNDLYVLTGSLYYLSSIRKEIKNLLNNENNK